MGDLEVKKRVEVWLKDTSQKLDISGLGLIKWPSSLIDVNMITKLDCSWNKLTSLPIFPKITYLKCSYNQLTSLPLLLNITELWCDNNQLTSLPLFPKLTELFCSWNRLTFLPPRLSKLTLLCCDGNALVSLPLRLLELTYLQCQYNKLTSLPSPSDLPKLTKVSCYNNALVSLPLRLPKLTYLDCSYNKLTSLPLFPNLTELCCSNTQSARKGNALFSHKLEDWKKVWRLKTVRSNEIKERGLKRVIKVLKNRLYLPKLDSLKQELVYSPNHPGKFYKNLRIGNWDLKSK